MYLAVQPAIGARVAVKVLKVDAAADSELVERFFNEARAVNVIRHEGIIDVFDLGRLPDGAPYIVMEHLEGASLGALLRRYRPFPLGTFGRIVGEVLAAVGAAHAKTIIHRDLKPDNVFVSPAGRVTVLDFGIAKLATADHVTTQTGGLLGTPAYMAPEQARSQPIDPRADLYAAGVILFEGATGAPPFVSGSLYELLDLHVKTSPPSPRSKNPAIPEALETVILRALAKDPADRFATAAAMREALLAAVADLPQSEFAELTITPPVSPGPPSDPLAPTAATHGSLAHGETMPSERSSPVEKLRPSHVQLSRRTVGALAGVAVLGLAAAMVMALREPAERSTAITTHDAGTIALTPFDASAPITVVAPAPPPLPPVDAPAPPQDVPVDAAHLPVDAGAKPRKPRPAAFVGPTLAELLENGSATLTVPNPSAFDPKRYYATALALAQRAGGTVFPIGMIWSGVNRSGTIDVTAGGAAHYNFVSRDNAKAPGNYCYIHVAIEAKRSYIAPGRPSDGTCNDVRMITPPSCSVPELWTRAAAEPVDPDDSPIDQVPLVTINKMGRRLQFSATDSKIAKFSVSLVDDCN